MKDAYDIDRQLGAGSFGKVFLAKNKADKSIGVAIKVIRKEKMTPDDLMSLKREVKIMQTVDHPNIVNYYETYDEKKYIYLCMELCKGGELLDKITKTGKPLSEK